MELHLYLSNYEESALNTRSQNLLLEKRYCTMMLLLHNSVVSRPSIFTGLDINAGMHEKGSGNFYTV